MNGIPLALLIQTAVMAAPSTTYESAYTDHVQNGRPLVILVGAEWCPACQTMKRSIMPEFRRRGGLSRVAFAQVDTDRQGELASRLTHGGPIPQLIVFHRSRRGILRQKLVGAQSIETLHRVVDQAVAATAEAEQPAPDATPDADHVAGMPTPDSTQQVD
ncbi:MAG: thioredoxin family protein [Pirellulales bacterium]|nr:thioredoxin family protein [Pirellulales bacterium]